MLLCSGAENKLGEGAGGGCLLQQYVPLFIGMMKVGDGGAFSTKCHTSV